MIKEKQKSEQETFWISTQELQVKPQIKFYEKLDELLKKIHFGKTVREICKPYYSSNKNCRPPIDPEVYFKMLMVGFFEDLMSERGIAVRCADSFSIRAFLHYDLHEATPEHSTMSVIRKRLLESIYSQVFSIVLKAMKQYGMVKGKNLSMDTSVIEANASLKSLKNRMTEESYAEYIKKLAQEAGIDAEDKAAVARFDRKREDRKTSNKEWYNPNDPDAKIGKTKDGATDMIYKPEHVVDLDTGAIIDANILEGDKGDTDGLEERIIDAQVRLNDISDDPTENEMVETITADKYYFNTEKITEIQNYGISTIIPDKDYNRNLDKLTDEEQISVESAKQAVKSEPGKALLRRRGMYVERSFAHVLDCGGSRRTKLRGTVNNQKRYLIATACFNLSLLMRLLFGFGTPKQLLCSLKNAQNFVFLLLNLLKNKIFIQYGNYFKFFIVSIQFKINYCVN